MKPLHGPSTDDIVPVQRKTGRCSPPFWTTLLIAPFALSRFKEMSCSTSARFLRSKSMNFKELSHGPNNRPVQSLGERDVRATTSVG